jgi:hypothetical protein
MKYYLPVMVAFIVMINVALGAVGDVSVSDTNTYLQPAQSLAGTASAQLSGLEAPVGANMAVPYQDSLSTQDSYSQSHQNNYPYIDQQASVSPQGSDSAYPAPWTSGPIQEQLTAEVLRLSTPAAESFTPDESLNFVSTSSPGKMVSGSTGYAGTEQTGSSYWYYPGQVSSANRFYVQTSSGLNTEAGCSYGGYLPLWADIKSSGNFFVYEWYPGESAPSVRGWGWTEKGYKKGWFSGDVPGWHTLCYNCGLWSNYIYIYVYPKAMSQPSGDYPGYVSNPGYPSQQTNPGYASQQTNPGYASNPSYASNPGYVSNPVALTQASLPAGAPTPPDPNAERLAMPDYNMYKPITSQTKEGTYHDYPAQKSSALAETYPIQTGYPGFANNPDQQKSYPASGSISAQSSYPGPVNNQASMGPQLQATNPAIINGPPSANAPAMTATSTKTCTTCTSSTVVKEGVCSVCPYPSGCPVETVSGSPTPPSGYTPHSYKAVYPKPSTCKCNEYYVQTCQGKLGTVAGVFCEEWLPLWSKISQPGVYWSYEWTMCTSSHGNYCAPEAKNFGNKGTGWYQTWFKGNEPGWHILIYQCNDWSNYVYIYVWPAD